MKPEHKRDIVTTVRLSPEENTDLVKMAKAGKTTKSTVLRAAFNAIRGRPLPSMSAADALWSLRNAVVDKSALVSDTRRGKDAVIGAMEAISRIDPSKL